MWPARPSLTSARPRTCTGITNHMSVVSAGLAASIREWFSEGEDNTTIETAERVDLKKVRRKSARRRSRPRALPLPRERKKPNTRKSTKRRALPPRSPRPSEPRSAGGKRPAAAGEEPAPQAVEATAAEAVEASVAEEAELRRLWSARGGRRPPVPTGAEAPRRAGSARCRANGRD